MPSLLSLGCKIQGNVLTQGNLVGKFLTRLPTETLRGCINNSGVFCRGFRRGLPLPWLSYSFFTWKRIDMTTLWKLHRGFENQVGKVCGVTTDPRNFHSKAWKAVIAAESASILLRKKVVCTHPYCPGLSMKSVCHHCGFTLIPLSLIEA